MITDLNIHSSFEVHGLPVRFADIEVPPFRRDPVQFEEMRTRLLAELQPGKRYDIISAYAAQLPKKVPYEAPMFIGRANRGKSYAAAMAARLAHRWLGRSAWINCSSDLQYRDDFVEKYLPMLARYPLVVFDDFQLVKPGSYEAKQLVAIVGLRYDARLPTIWTGNFTGTATEIWKQIGALFEKAGPNMVHRLRAGSEGFRAEIT